MSEHTTDTSGAEIVNGTVWPIDREEHEAQLAALLALIPEGASVLDIGSGAGRIAMPLAASGRSIIAVDHDEVALKPLDSVANVHAHQADVLDAAQPLVPGETEPIDWAICVGHTFMLFHDVRAAAASLSRVRETLLPGGGVIIDNFPAVLWNEVADGYWQSGVSEAGDQQLIWAPSDNVFALRKGDMVDTDDWAIREGDVLHRLWSMGELTLLATVSGFEPPMADESGELLVFRKA